MLVAALAGVTVGVVFFGISSLQALREVLETNAKTLERIRCRESEAVTVEMEHLRCDISALQNDVTFDPADYVITRETGALVWSQMKHARFGLNKVDIDFVRRFREPMSAIAVTGAKWRLHSEAISSSVGGREVIVGYLEDADWLVEPTPASPRIDRLLREEAGRIAKAAKEGREIDAGRINSKLDGWAVLDAETGEPIVWNGDLPGRLTEHARWSLSGWFHWDGGRIYLVRQEVRNQLIVISLGFVTDIWKLASTLAGTIMVVLVSTYWICAGKFRKQFLMIGRRRVSVGEALKIGENERIEFKRDAGDRESLLRTITAFANSSDGTIFIGIGDAGEVVGLRQVTLTEKDQFVTALQNAMRDRIRPTPFIDVNFEEVNDRTIAKIFVPRGDQPLYCCDGRPYLRRGPQSVAGSGDEVAKIVFEFA